MPRHRAGDDPDIVPIEAPKGFNEPVPDPPLNLNYTPLYINPGGPPSGYPRVPEGVIAREPLELFRVFFSTDQLDQICTATNENYRCKASQIEAPKGQPRPWKPLTHGELLAYLGVQIWFGLDRVPKI
jgi:hypothetical protein